MSGERRQKRLCKAVWLLLLQKAGHEDRQALQTVHRNEAEVRKLRTAEKEGGVSAMDRLRNFNHNVDVLLSGSGNLVAGRMINHSGQEYSAADFLQCKYCLRFFNKELWRHALHCEATDDKPFCEKDIQAAGKLLLAARRRCRHWPFRLGRSRTGEMSSHLCSRTTWVSEWVVA